MKQKIKQSVAVNGQIADAKKRATDLQTVVSDVGERLARQKTQYESGVESGEDDSKLDTRDEEIIRTERELVRAQIRLGQSKAEIESLEAQHAAAVTREREEAFLQLFDELCDKFVMFEMALMEFQSRKSEIEDVIRTFQNQAVQAGRDIRRLDIAGKMKMQVSERLYPTLTSKWSERREQFSRPMADELERHVRWALNISPTNDDKASQSTVSDETHTERSIQQ